MNGTFPSPFGWLSGLFGWIAAVLTLLAGLFAAAGCQSQATEVERAWTFVGERIIGPAVVKAIEETSTRTATLQGGAQVIEPGYSVDFEGFWVTGLKGRAVVRTVGVSGQITGHAQGDAGQAATVDPPVHRETKPTGVITTPQAMKPEDPAMEVGPARGPPG